MKLKLRNVNRVTVVEIEGKVTVGERVLTLRRALAELLADGCFSVVLCLQKTSYVDSCGLSELVASYRRARERGGTIRLIAPPPRLRELLRMTRLDRVLEVHATESEALASLGTQPIRRPPKWASCL